MSVKVDDHYKDYIYTLSEGALRKELKNLKTNFNNLQKKKSEASWKQSKIDKKIKLVKQNLNVKTDKVS